MNDQRFMREKAILSLVLSMSIPMVLSMAVNATYNIVDSYFVAKINEDAMTALSLVYPIQNLSGAIAIGFGVGSCAAISFFLGAESWEDATAATNLGYTVSCLHGVIFAICGIICIKPFISLFTDSEQLIQYGCEYAYIVLLFAPANHVAMHAEKVLQAAGRMTETMFGMIVACVFNIIMDPLMIFGIGPFPVMGIKGAALATGLAQVIACMFYAGFGIIKPLPVDTRLRDCINPSLLVKDLSGSTSIVKRIYGVGIPATLNLALPSFLISALNAILAGFAASCVLVLGAYYKLQTFLYLSANGIIQGIRPIVGYNYGAGEYGRVRKTQYVTLAICVCIMAVGTALCIIMPDRLIGLFTENAATVAEGAAALRIICAGFILSAVSVTVSGVLEGIGQGGKSLIISLCRYIVVILPVAFILSRFMGASGVWHAFWVTELVTAVIAFKLRPIK